MSDEQALRLLQALAMGRPLQEHKTIRELCVEVLARGRELKELRHDRDELQQLWIDAVNAAASWAEAASDAGGEP